ncbi:hypothetical protein D3C74_84420 [compost metagenome]
MHVLCTQYFSAFLATGSQHSASVLRAHSFTEAVNLFTLADIWFESRSQCIAPPYKKYVLYGIYSIAISTKNTFLHLTIKIL